MKLTAKLCMLLEGSRQRKNKFNPNNDEYADDMKKWTNHSKDWGAADSSLRDAVGELDKESKTRLIMKITSLTKTKKIKGEHHFLMFRGMSEREFKKFVSGDFYTANKKISFSLSSYVASKFGGAGLERSYEHLKLGDYTRAGVLPVWVPVSSILHSPIMHGITEEYEILLKPSSKLMIADKSDILDSLRDSYGLARNKDNTNILKSKAVIKYLKSKGKIGTEKEREEKTRKLKQQSNMFSRSKKVM